MTRPKCPSLTVRSVGMMRWEIIIHDHKEFLKERAMKEIKE